MAAVKASKQQRMVVVPHRPWQRAAMLCLVVAAAVAACWLAYVYGVNKGMAAQVDVIEERDAIQGQLAENLLRLEELRQQLAEVRLQERVDPRANEQVQQTVEELQERVAMLSEEVRFYKGVMVPNAEERGLRIERLSVRNSGDPHRYRYSLLLTQVVDEHDYVQGGVDIRVEGVEGAQTRSLPLEAVSDSEGSLRFRFRYFQNLDGEMEIPPGFEPRAITVVAQASGGQRLERSFDWEG